MVSKWKTVGAAMCASVAMLANAAGADTVGTIGVALTVTNACVVNGSAAVQANGGQLGQITFPDQPGLFGDVNGELIATGTSGALSVLCSPGAAPSLVVGPGSNDLAGARRLAHNGTAVAYRLFSDAGRTTEITIGQRLSLPVATTTPTLVPLYARVSSQGVILPAGIYTDTVQVTLSW